MSPLIRSEIKRRLRTAPAELQEEAAAARAAISYKMDDDTEIVLPFPPFPESIVYAAGIRDGDPGRLVPPAEPA
jgi:hypothetical protein